MGGVSFPEAEDLPEFETAEFETLLGEALGPWIDADLAFDDWAQASPQAFSTDTPFALHFNDGAGAPEGPSEGASAETGSGTSARTGVLESADASAGKSTGEAAPSPSPPLLLLLLLLPRSLRPPSAAPSWVPSSIRRQRGRRDVGGQGHWNRCQRLEK